MPGLDFNEAISIQHDQGRRSQPENYESIAPHAPSSSPESALPAGFFGRLGRHDPHNLELKAGFNLAGHSPKGSVEVAVFFPKSVHMRGFERAEIIGDFFSRLRLTLPRGCRPEPGNLQRVEDELKRLLRDLISVGRDTPAAHHLSDLVLQSVRQFGALIGEYLKEDTRFRKRELLMIHSLAGNAIDPTERFQVLVQQVSGVYSRIRSVRQLVEEFREAHPSLLLLSDYATYLFQSSWVGLVEEFEKLRAGRIQHSDAELFAPGWAIWDEFCDSIHSQEVRSQGAGFWSEDEVERERQVIRLSHMKKFFQSEMFIDVSKRQGIRKLSEPLAALAASFAALWAALFERFANPNWVDVGFRGLFVICLGIALYVLRDRLKDQLRIYLVEKLARHLPETEQDLMAQGKNIGKAKEWYTIRDRSQINPELAAWRDSVCTSEAEKHLSEDVLVHRREYSVRAMPSFQSTARADEVALQEVLRINFQRYLKHMDDPFKSFSYLDPRGGISVLRSHRVYPFLAFVRIESGAHTKTRSYRILLDKNGIDRVEEL